MGAVLLLVHGQVGDRLRVTTVLAPPLSLPLTVRPTPALTPDIMLPQPAMRAQSFLCAARMDTAPFRAKQWKAGCVQAHPCDRTGHARAHCRRWRTACDNSLTSSNTLCMKKAMQCARSRFLPLRASSHPSSLPPGTPCRSTP